MNKIIVILIAVAILLTLSLLIYFAPFHKEAGVVIQEPDEATVEKIKNTKRAKVIIKQDSYFFEDDKVENLSELLLKLKIEKVEVVIIQLCLKGDSGKAIDAINQMKSFGFKDVYLSTANESDCISEEGSTKTN